MIKSIWIKRRCRKPKFVVIVTCQGQPFYYEYRTIIGAFAGYIKKYVESRKYGTKNIAIKEFRSMPFWENI